MNSASKSAQAGSGRITWQCACFNTRKASRAVTRFYDEILAPSGLKATHFTMLPGTGDKHKHAATRTFQGIRIHINHELDELQRALSQAIDVLSPGGRLVVISFHSLEDRIVKRFFRAESQSRMNPDMPLAEPTGDQRLRVLGSARHAGAAEIANNPRARSAVMRVAERLPIEGAVS